MAKWEPSGQDCPRCDQETETSTEVGDDSIKYDTGERCTHCRWVVDFTKDEIKAKGY